MIIKDNKAARNDNDIHQAWPGSSPAPDYRIISFVSNILLRCSTTEQAITTITWFLMTIWKIFSDFLLFDKIFCASKDFVIHSQLEMKGKLG